MATKVLPKRKKPAVRAADLPAKKPIPVDNKKLIEWAKKNPPPQSWFEEPDIVYTSVKRKNRK